MRDLLFKNLTSADRKRKIISSCEIAQKQGIRSVIRRHFVCIVKEIKHKDIEKPAPYLYVLKIHNTKDHTEKFFCRIKGSVIVILKQKLFLILFMHSLRIELRSVSRNMANYA